jgi:hypothetical protein
MKLFFIGVSLCVVREKAARLHMLWAELGGGASEVNATLINDSGELDGCVLYLF